MERLHAPTRGRPAPSRPIQVSERRRSMVVDPPDGRVPVMKWAEDKRDLDLAHVPDAPGHETPWVRCITRGHPAGTFPAGYNHAYRIIQVPGYVVIAFEMIHETRIIPIDGRPPLAAGIRHWNGEPRGRWEGDTLVVESTNYNSKGSIAMSAATGRMRGIPQTDAMRVVERFTRVDADTIDYSVTIEDPKVYTRPWTVELPLNRDDSYQIYEYSCHEGNYALPNALSSTVRAWSAMARDSRGGPGARSMQRYSTPRRASSIESTEPTAPRRRSGLALRWSSPSMSRASPIVSPVAGGANRSIVSTLDLNTMLPLCS